MSSWRIIVLCWLGAFLWLSGCSEPPGLPSGEPAPGFELERLNGERVSLDQLRGQTVLLDFWATWCPPCVLEIPELNAFYEAHREHGVVVLAISIDDLPVEELARWVREKGVRYPVAMGTAELAREYGAFQFPAHILVGPDGNVLERLPAGYHDREELAELLGRHRSS